MYLFPRLATHFVFGSRSVDRETGNKYLRRHEHGGYFCCHSDYWLYRVGGCLKRKPSFDLMGVQWKVVFEASCFVTDIGRNDNVERSHWSPSTVSHRVVAIMLSVQLTAVHRSIRNQTSRSCGRNVFFSFVVQCPWEEYMGWTERPFMDT